MFVINREVIIGLIKLFLAFQINLETLIIIFSLLNSILEFEHINLESLPLDFSESVINRCELLLVFRFLYQSEGLVEVSLVSLRL